MPRAFRKPTAVKALEGTDRPDRAYPNEPKPEGSFPAMPSHLSPQARVVWHRVEEAVSGCEGWITAPDAETLALYCETLADYWRARDDVRKEGMYTETAHGAKGKHPAVLILEKARNDARIFATELGLTPSAR